jgi:hypothetical protein
VGRREDCDFRVDHKSVSKQHCVLVKTDGVVLVRDLGSTNGTRVNGTRVRRATLVPNDEIAFAGIKYRLAVGRPTAPASHGMPTQPLDAEELGRLVSPEPDPPAPGQPRVEVHTDDLPDVYPADLGPRP